MKRAFYMMVLMAASACSSGLDLESGSGGDAGRLCITAVEESDAPESKAAPVTSLSGMHDSFDLFEYIYTDSPGAPTRYRETMTREPGTSVWKSAASDYGPVPSDRKTLYWALAPRNASGVEFPSATYSGSPKFSYVSPSNVSSQKDLMVATCGPEYGRPLNPSMKFSHLLAGVQFKVGEIAPQYSEIMIVLSATLKNIYTSGEYVFDVGDGGVTGQWTGLGGIGDRTLVKSMVYDRSTSGTVFGGSSTMFLLPQTCPQDAELDVELSDGKHLTTSLAGLKLRQGKLNVITLDRLMEITVHGEDEIDVGESKPYTASWRFSDGTVDPDVTEDVTFYSTNHFVARFDGNVLTGVSPGTAGVYACKGDVWSLVDSVKVNPYYLRYAVGGYPDEYGREGVEVIDSTTIFYGETLYGEVYSGDTPVKRVYGSVTNNVQGIDSEYVIGWLGDHGELIPYGFMNAFVVVGARRYVEYCTVNTIPPGLKDQKPGFVKHFNDGTSISNPNGGCEYWMYNGIRIEAGSEYGGRTVEGDPYSMFINVPVRAGRALVDRVREYFNYVH